MSVCTRSLGVSQLLELHDVPTWKLTMVAGMLRSFGGSLLGTILWRYKPLWNIGRRGFRQLHTSFCEIALGRKDIPFGALLVKDTYRHSLADAAYQSDGTGQSGTALPIHQDHPGA